MLNTGRITPLGNPDETARQFISDLDAMILADAYDYTVNLPSNIDSAHVTLDSLTGTLLVQGGVNSAGDARNESFSITESGSNIQVQITMAGNVTTELVPRAAVNQLVIATNGGTDGIFVAQSLDNIPGFRKDVQYVVSSNQDPTTVPDQNGDGFVDHDVNVPGRQISLRGALADLFGTANGSAIYVPRGHYELTAAGTGGFVAGDLEIDKHTIIIGSGAGVTVIDGSGLSMADRLFEINHPGSLDLSRVTLTGGQNFDGGAIRVNQSTNPGVTELTLREVAIVGNTATNFGGGVYLEPGASALVYRSVITDNTAQGNDGGGGIYLGGNGSVGGTASLVQSLIAKNSSGNGNGADLRSIPIATFSSGGWNLLTSVTGSNLTAPGSLQSSDYLNSNVDYIVTSFVDSFDHMDDVYALSIREAIDTANTTTGTQEVWLPAWSFVLTIDRGTNPTDTDVSYGDLDIHQSLVIRGSGISGATSVRWRPGVVDKVFEQLGDYNGNHWVEIADWTIWRNTYGSTTFLAADGDDDGDVDNDDLTIWGNHFGNTLGLPSVTVIT